MKRKIISISLITIVTAIVLSLSSYAFYETMIDKTNNSNATGSVTSAIVSMDIDYSGNLNSIFNNIIPETDADGINNAGFEFTLTNTGTKNLYYKIILNTLALDDPTYEKLNSMDLKFNLSLKSNPSVYNTYSLVELRDGIFLKNNIKPEEEQEYVLRAWLDIDADNDSMGKYFKASLSVVEIPEPETYQIINEFAEADLKEVIRCDQDKTNCAIYNTIEDAVAASNSSLIILTRDLNKSNYLNIDANKNIILDLNGKKYIKDNDANTVIRNYGTLTINDTMENGYLVNALTSACGHGLLNYGSLVLNGGTYESKNTCNTIYVGGMNNYIGNAIVNKARVRSGANSAFLVYSAESNPLVINDIICTGKGNAELIRTNSSVVGEININGGIYISYKKSVLLHSADHQLTITQTTKPIYMTDLAQSWIGIIGNQAGDFSITANAANNCTQDPLDTTSGLCLYVLGNKIIDPTGNPSGNVTISNTSTGSFVINGGTYYGNYCAINHAGTGTANIKNINASGTRAALRNSGTGVLNICNTTSQAIKYDLMNTDTGTINYYNVTFTTGTTTPGNKKIYNPNGTVNELSSCPF